MTRSWSRREGGRRPSTVGAGSRRLQQAAAAGSQPCPPTPHSTPGHAAAGQHPLPPGARGHPAGRGEGACDWGLASCRAAIATLRSSPQPSFQSNIRVQVCALRVSCCLLARHAHYRRQRRLPPRLPNAGNHHKALRNHDWSGLPMRFLLQRQTSPGRSTQRTWLLLLLLLLLDVIRKFRNRREGREGREGCSDVCSLLASVLRVALTRTKSQSIHNGGAGGRSADSAGRSGRVFGGSKRQQPCPRRRRACGACAAAVHCRRCQLQLGRGSASGRRQCSPRGRPAPIHRCGRDSWACAAPIRGRVGNSRMQSAPVHWPAPIFCLLGLTQPAPHPPHTPPNHHHPSTHCP